jgi:hypothetical protein
MKTILIKTGLYALKLGASCASFLIKKNKLEKTEEINAAKNILEIMNIALNDGKISEAEWSIIDKLIKNIITGALASDDNT